MIGMRESLARGCLQGPKRSARNYNADGCPLAHGEANLADRGAAFGSTGQPRRGRARTHTRVAPSGPRRRGSTRSRARLGRLVITEPDVGGAILRHLARTAGRMRRSSIGFHRLFVPSNCKCSRIVLCSRCCEHGHKREHGPGALSQVGSRSRGCAARHPETPFLVARVDRRPSQGPRARMGPTSVRSGSQWREGRTLC